MAVFVGLCCRSGRWDCLMPCEVNGMTGYQCCTDMETWLHDVGGDRLFRFWVYKRMFTPEEVAKQWSDQSVFEDTHCNTGFIREVIDLGSGEWLLGIEPVYDELLYETRNIEYYKLSDIHLEWWKKDMEELDESYQPEED